MKLETAKKLSWPWETEKLWFIPIQDGKIIAAPIVVLKKERGNFCRSNADLFIPSPSVEEMLERMPISTTLRKHESLETKKIVYTAGYGHGVEKIRGDTPAEALALLCIWLRDNKLMEGWKDERK